ncbi:RidA family protein [Dinoroseobacter sp. PD6]|uniref:RidA family protein n=1 Tax=Dinoroseobacter sp. PD6 TaxID=3028384 RepID=UPI00237A3C8A|nr:RidA family protein [Dinoroseobacter sp. PD6]MDD9718087.1 RidA family protein [Dinoroseobacter sp. PD6]
MRRLISTGSPFEATMGYSRAVVQGDWCFLSGVTGYDYAAMTLPNVFEDQVNNCFKTIFEVLREADFPKDSICKVQYILADRGLVQTVAPLLGRHLGDIRPAATMIIAGLIEPEMLIEIDVTAFKG